MNLREAPDQILGFYDGVEEAIPESILDVVAAARILLEARQLVDAQAEDDGLWFEAQTAPEAYLQQELRRLHAVVESVDP